MTRRTMALALVLAAFCNATPALAAPHKIGSVDYAELLKDYEKSKQAVAELQESKDKGEAELTTEWENYKKLIEEASSMKDDLRKNPPKTPEEKQARTKAIKDIVFKVEAERDRLTKLKEEREGTYLKRYAAIVAEVTADIQAAVKKMADETGCDLVISSVGNSKRQAPLVLYADDKNDLTDPVLATLNAAAPKK